jgi:hypothetical protein
MQYFSVLGCVYGRPELPDGLRDHDESGQQFWRQYP